MPARTAIHVGRPTRIGSHARARDDPPRWRLKRRFSQAARSGSSSRLDEARYHAQARSMRAGCARRARTTGDAADGSTRSDTTTTGDTAPGSARAAAPGSARSARATATGTA